MEHKKVEIDKQRVKITSAKCPIENCEELFIISQGNHYSTRELRTHVDENHSFDQTLDALCRLMIDSTVEFNRTVERFKKEKKRQT